MPEGHAIHSIAQDHQNYFAGKKVAVCSPQGRFKKQSAMLSGKKLREVSAHGKHLFYHWNRDAIVHIHLGLYGKFRKHKNPAPEPRGAVRMRMISRQFCVDLNGPSCCELVDLVRFRRIKNRLGQDPLRADACRDSVWKRICGSRAAIGSLLMNQSVIAGIGNIYRAEILFLLGIHPDLSTKHLGRERFVTLWNLATELMTIGVKYKRIITVPRNQTEKPLSRLNAAERLNVYKRANCLRCGSRIRSWILGNRRIYACTKCQTKARVK